MEQDKNLKNFIKRTLKEFLNEQSLKGAVDFERNKRLMSDKRLNKIKWFDNLTYREKQDYYNELKGRKSDLVWIKDGDKVSIYNKINNGDYNNF
jgi:hypothetical protein